MRGLLRTPCIFPHFVYNLTNRVCSRVLWLEPVLKCVLHREKVVRDFYRSSFVTMAQKLYVGGLPYSTTDQELADAFAAAGNVVSASIVIDRMTGRSRGFGFVEMSTEDEANAAIDMWHGKEFGGRMLTVNIARPKEDRPMGDRGPRRDYGAPREYGSR